MTAGVEPWTQGQEQTKASPPGPHQALEQEQVSFTGTTEMGGASLTGTPSDIGTRGASPTGTPVGSPTDTGTEGNMD